MTIVYKCNYKECYKEVQLPEAKLFKFKEYNNSHNYNEMIVDPTEIVCSFCSECFEQLKKDLKPYTIKGEK